MMLKDKNKTIFSFSKILVIIIALLILLTSCQPYSNDKSLNITEDELLEILRVEGVRIVDSTLEIGGKITNNPVYGITCEGETGILVVCKNRRDYVECFMISFDDVIYSAAITAIIASEIDNSYSIEDSAVPLVFDGIYTSNNLTAMKKTLVEDLTVIILAPSEHLDYCLERILMNK